MLTSSASRWLLVLPASLLFACGSGPKSATPANKTFHVSGKVVTETNLPIPGATVALPSLSATATTDANGAYDVVAKNAKAGDSVAVLVTHPDFSRLTSTLGLATELTAKDYSLRRHDKVMDVVLPASATDAPAVVGTTREDGGTSLSIGFGALTLPNGTAATGTATVKLSYWHPAEDLTTAPAPLVGALAGNPNAMGIFTYGMANIEISQGTDELKVADGKTLDLAFTQPADFQADLLATTPDASGAPMLWYADETTGVWTSVGSIATGSLAIAADGKTITAKLPHLSGFNIDGITTINQCVTALVKDKCGKPQANADLTLWLTGGGQVLKYDIHTGADGKFCANLIGSSTAGAKDNKVDFYAWTSARNLPAQTACNPLGKDDVGALCDKGPLPWCTGNDEYAQPDSRNNGRISYVSESQACQIPLTSVPMCGFCAGTASNAVNGQCRASTTRGTVVKGKMVEGQCGTMPDITVPWCGTPPTSNDPCTAGGARGEGESCEVTAQCCPNDKLICSDFLCVPIKD